MYSFCVDQQELLCVQRLIDIRSSRINRIILKLPFPDHTFEWKFEAQAFPTLLSISLMFTHCKKQWLSWFAQALVSSSKCTPQYLKQVLASFYSDFLARCIAFTLHSYYVLFFGILNTTAFNRDIHIMIPY